MFDPFTLPFSFIINVLIVVKIGVFVSFGSKYFPGSIVWVFPAVNHV